MSCRGHRASAGSTRKKSKSHSLLYRWATDNNHQSIQEKRPRVVSNPNPTNFVLYNNDFSSYSFFSWAFTGKCHFEEDLGDATELK